MGKYVIEGGRTLTGRVPASGAKNAVLPILAASTLTEDSCTIHRVPQLNDVQVMTGILERLGYSLSMDDPGPLKPRTLSIAGGAPASTEVPPDLVGKMRSSVFLMGPLLARYGEVIIQHPGGCDIGSRPIDFHLAGLRALGAEISEEGGIIRAHAPQLRGSNIVLDYPSVGATENLLMASVLAQGETRIQNAAREPEIRDLARFMGQMGAQIQGAGSSTITVRGVPRLEGTDYQVMADRIETGTYLIAGALTGGTVTVGDSCPQALEALLAKLRQAGVNTYVDGNDVQVEGPSRLLATDVRTQPYPGFPTDLQNQFLVLMTLARGTSVITETIFENRFKVTGELSRMGARVRVHGNSAIVQGVDQLTGAAVKPDDDLRGGASLVLAGLAAGGQSVVDGASNIQRGYEHLTAKLSLLGAELQLK